MRMKKFHLILISLLAMASVVCCEGFETITGEQSELGEVGTTLTGSFKTKGFILRQQAGAK